MGAYTHYLFPITTMTLRVTQYLRLSTLGTPEARQNTLMLAANAVKHGILPISTNIPPIKTQELYVTYRHIWCHYYHYVPG